jgi:hypothetical protein
MKRLIFILMALLSYGILRAETLNKVTFVNGVQIKNKSGKH